VSIILVMEAVRKYVPIVLVVAAVVDLVQQLRTAEIVQNAP
jgi:hypothetical protein